MTHPLRRACVLVLLAAGALTGCSGPTVTPAPSASLAAYRPPAAAPSAVVVRAGDRAEAVDAVLRFFDALNYGYAHADADPLRRMSALSCSPCVGWIEDVQHLEDAGRHQDGGWVRVVGMTAAGAQDGRFAFRASLLREPGSVVGAGGATPVVAGGKGELVDLVVSPETSSVSGETTWTVVQMALAPIGDGSPGTGAP